MKTALDKKIEELKKEIKRKRDYRLFEISDDIFQRYNNGEVNLSENLFNEFKELIRRTTDIEIAKAKLSAYEDAQKIFKKDRELLCYQTDLIIKQKDRDFSEKVKELKRQ